MTGDPIPPAMLDADMAMARTLRALGRADRAVSRYDAVLASHPALVEPLDEVLEILEERSDLEGIELRCSRWLAVNPDHATNAAADRIHSRRIDALCRLGGIDLALSTYGLEPVVNADRPIGADDIVALAVVRNEAKRLPAFLEWHRRIGVDRFLVVDNDSEDGTGELLSGESDVTLWRTDHSYRASNCGAAWWDLLLRRYVDGNWCLVLDADERFIFPDCEVRGLRDLCRELDERGSTCYTTVFLDMYGDGPISMSALDDGQDPIETFPYFDHLWYRRRRPFAGPRRNLVNHWGGMRARVFGEQMMGSYLLDKVPLFRHRPGELMMSGNHWLDRPSSEIDDGRGALLHFKFGAGFQAFVASEAARGEHAGGARAHRQLAGVLAKAPDPIPFHPDHSIRFRDTAQLVELGILRDPRSGSARRSPGAGLRHPAIPPAPLTVAPIHWSFVVAADGRSEDVRQRVGRLVLSLEGESPSEVVVVGRRSDDESGFDSIHSVHPAGTEIVRVETPFALTELELLNLGIASSRGSWVLVLDSGSELRPGVLADVDARLAGAAGPPSILVAGRRNDGEDRRVPTDAPLELPLGLAPSDVIVRRDVFVEVGGFAPMIPGAATWEFVQRSCRSGGRVEWVDGPFVVTPMAAVDPELNRFGEPLLQTVAAVGSEIALAELGEQPSVELYERCAVLAGRLIDSDLGAGNVQSAFATLVEVLRLPMTPNRRSQLVESIGRRLH